MTPNRTQTHAIRSTLALFAAAIMGVTLALVTSTNSASSDNHPPGIHVNLTHQAIYLDNFPTGVELSIQVGEAEEPIVRTLAEQPGQANSINQEHHGQTLAAGTTVTVTGPDEFERTYIVQPISIDPESSIEAGTFAGTAASSATITLLISTEFGLVLPPPQVAADSSGNWSVSLDPIPDGITAVTAQVTSESGTTSAMFPEGGGGPSPQSPMITVSITAHWIMLHNFPPDTAVQVEIDTHTVGVSTDGDRFAFIPQDTHGQTLAPGTIITVTGPDEFEHTYTVQPISFNPESDFETGTFTGVTTPEAFVNLFVLTGVGEQPVLHTQTVATQAGNWSITLEEVPEGITEVIVQVGSAFGATRASIHPEDGEVPPPVDDPEPHITVLLTPQVLRLLNMPETPLSVEIGDVTLELESGGGSLIDLFGDALGAAVLSADSAITVSNADGVIASYTPAPLTIDPTYDPLAGSISGTGPTGVELVVRFFESQEQQGPGVFVRNVTPDEGGNWTATYGEESLEARESVTFVRVGVVQQDGTTTANTLQPPPSPGIHVNLTHHSIYLNNFPTGVELSIQVGDAEPIVRTLAEQPGPLNAINQEDHEQTLDVETIITVTGPDEFEHAYTVQPFNFDPESSITEGTFSGSTVPNGHVILQIFTDMELPPVVEVSEFATGEGDWSFTLDPIPDGITQVLARVRSESGSTGASIFPEGGGAPAPSPGPRSIHASLTNHWIILYNFPPSTDVQLTVTGAESSVDPVTVTIGESGSRIVSQQIHGGVLQVGTTIAVIDPDTQEELHSFVLEAVTIDSALNPDTGFIGGTAPGTDRALHVHFYVQDQWVGSIPTTSGDADGWGVTYNPTDFGEGAPAIADITFVQVGLNGDGGVTFVNTATPAPVPGSGQQPHIHLNLTENFIWLIGFAGETTLNVQIGDAGPYEFTTNDGGLAALWHEVHGQDLVPGITVTVSDAETTLATYTAEQGLAITVPGFTDGQVQGTAPPGASVNVFIYSGPGPHVAQDSVVADGNGAWSANFAVPAGGVSRVTADVWTPQGTTLVSVQPPRLNATLAYWGHSLSLDGWAPATAVTITRGADEWQLTTDANGRAHQNVPANAPLEVGQTITATDGVTTKTLVIPELTVQADPDAGLLSGTAPPGSQLNGFACVHPNPCSNASAQADGDGNYSMNVGTQNLVPGGTFGVNLSDLDGDNTQVYSQLAPPPGVTAIITPWRDQLRLQGWTPSTPVIVTREGGGSWEVTIDASGNGHLNLPEGVQLAAGNVLTATNGPETIVMTVASLTISADPATGTVSGTAPASVQLDLWGCTDGLCPNARINSTGAGIFSHSFGQGALGAGAYFGVRYVQDVSRATEVHGQLAPPPRIIASLGWWGHQVRLEGWPAGATVTVALGGQQAGSVTIDAQGVGHLELEVGTLATGTVIGASGGGQSVSYTVQALGLSEPNTDTGQVSGTAGAGQQIHLWVCDRNNCQGQPVLAGAGGVFSHTFGGGAFTPGAHYGASVSQGFNRTHVQLRIQPPPELWAILGWWGHQVQFQNWTPGSNVTVTRDEDTFGPYAIGPQGFGHGNLPQGSTLSTGDVLVATGTEGGETTTHTVMDITVEVVDAGGNVRAEGTLTVPNGTDVHVWACHTQTCQHATVTVSGNAFAHTFTGLAYGPGVHVGASAWDEHNNRTQAVGRVVTPWITAVTGLGNGQVLLRDWPAGATVTISRGQDQLGTVEVDEGGFGFLSPGHGFTFEAGNVITATSNGVTKTLTIVGLTVEAQDVEAGILTGTGPENEPVNVWFCHEEGCAGLNVTTDGGGSFTANFGPNTLRPGANIGVSHGDADLDRSHHQARITSGGRIAAILTADGGGIIELRDWTPGTPVNIAVGVGESIQVTPNADGFAATAVDGLGIGVTVTGTPDGGAELSYQVENVTASTNGQTLSGQAPAGRTVQLFACRDGICQNATVTADGGTYTHTFTGGLLGSGAIYSVTVRHPDGHRTTLQGALE